MLGCVFLVALTFYMVGVLKIVSFRRRLPSSASVLTASVFLGIPLLFHFLSRADFNHFAEKFRTSALGSDRLQGFLSESKKRWASTLVTAVLASLALTAVTYSPRDFACLAKSVPSHAGKRGNGEINQVLQDTLWVPAYQPWYVEYVKQLVADRVGPNENILIGSV